MNKKLQELYERSNSLLLDQKWEESVSVLTEIISLEPNQEKRAIAYYNRGNAKDELGQHQAAIADYDKAIQFNFDDARVYSNRGNVKNSLGKHQAAIADFDKAIQLNPDDAEPYNNRGGAKFRLGDLQAAIADYDKAIQLKTDCDKAVQLKADYAGIYYNRGNAKFRLGNLQAAIADYDKAIQLKTDYARVYYNRGNAKFLLGEPQAAIADYDKAIQFNSYHAEAYNNRGNAKFGLDDYDGAFKDFMSANKHKKPLKLHFPLIYIAYRIDAIFSNNLQDGNTIFKLYVRLLIAITNIQKKLFYQEQTEIAHYTSIHTLKSLAQKKRFRFYNTSDMNDPEEGQAFFAIMNEKVTGVDINVKSLFYSNNPRLSPAYIGSFAIVDSENQEPKDKLILWRLYGKQDKEEATGACLIFKPDNFAKSPPQQLGGMAGMVFKVAESDAQELAKTHPALYKVTYISDHKDANIDKDLQELLTSLAKSLKKIDDLITQNKWKSKENDLRELVGELLDSIRFLFKKTHYQEEHEVRVIDLHYYEKGMGEKPDRVKVDEEQIPPRFYLEISENFRFSEVILGPRAQNIKDLEMWIKNQNQEIDVQQSVIPYGSEFS